MCNAISNTMNFATDVFKYFACALLLGLTPTLLGAQGNLEVKLTAIDQSCANVSDGQIQIQALAGKFPINFDWKKLGTSLNGSGLLTQGNPFSVLENLGKGSYRFTFTDASGVSKAIEKMLGAPDSIKVQLHAEGDVCLGANEGLIRVEHVSGGTAPFVFALGNQGFSNIQAWDSLVPGAYFIRVRDANGCTFLSSAILPTGTQFVVDPLPDTSIISGDTLLYKVVSNNAIDTIIWLPSIYAQTLDDGNIRLFPYFPTVYKFLAIDVNGCQAISELFVNVTRRRNVYFPNVFQPDAQDNTNRFFTAFTGDGVSYVKSLQVFDRLGRGVFEKFNFVPNAPNQGWDGFSEGIEMPAGVYIWGAVLHFFDGRDEHFWGDVTLIR